MMTGKQSFAESKCSLLTKGCHPTRSKGKDSEAPCLSLQFLKLNKKESWKDYHSSKLNNINNDDDNDEDDDDNDDDDNNDDDDGAAEDDRIMIMITLTTMIFSQENTSQRCSLVGLCRKEIERKANAYKIGYRNSIKQHIRRERTYSPLHYQLHTTPTKF